MELVELYEKALREDWRFPYKGLEGADIKDLWKLTIPSLKKLYMELRNSLVDTTGSDIFDTETPADRLTRLKIELVERVAQVKKEEAKAKLEAKEKREIKQNLLAIKAKKEQEKYENMSEEELDKLLDELS